MHFPDSGEFQVHGSWFESSLIHEGAWRVGGVRELRIAQGGVCIHIQQACKK